MIYGLNTIRIAVLKTVFIRVARVATGRQGEKLIARKGATGLLLFTLKARDFIRQIIGGDGDARVLGFVERGFDSHHLH